MLHFQLIFIALSIHSFVLSEMKNSSCYLQFENFARQTERQIFNTFLQFRRIQRGRDTPNHEKGNRRTKGEEGE